jgi:GntR family transcriptional regulator, transcriptional repressor for pyruvate dehydrogenase complex
VDRHEAAAAEGRREAALSELRPLVARRASDEVAEQIRALIIAAGLHEGDRLPAERQLAETLHSSRVTVSQALRTLSMMGLVEIRRGSGAYVTRNPATVVSSSIAAALEIDPDSAPELAQLRYWLERTAAFELQSVRDDDDLVAVADALERLRRSVEGSASTYITADALFHAAIVRGAHNRYLSAVYESVHNAVVKLSYADWIEEDRMPYWRQSPADTRRHIALHRDILSGIQSGDPAALDTALLHHHRVLIDHIMRPRPHDA